MSLQLGDLVNERYRIEERLARGGMGAIYRAQDENLGVACAVKENLAGSEEGERQFLREAQLLAGLRHPNLPRVTDHFAIPDQGQYLVMDFVEGDDLDSLLEQGETVPERQLLRWMREIFNAVAYLHSHAPPVVHRDIKPANIKITPEGRAVLVDFGLAKVHDPSRSTTIGAKGFSPGFAPPEQLGIGAHTDARTDVYALGATIYNLLAGELPADALGRFLGHAELKPLSELLPGVSPLVANAVDTALELKPEDRWQSVEEFWGALTGSQTEQLVRPHLPAAALDVIGTQPSPGKRELESQTQNRLWFYVGGAVLVVVLIGAAILWPRLTGTFQGEPVAVAATDTPAATEAPTSEPSSATSEPTSSPTAEPTSTPAAAPSVTPEPTEAMAVGGAADASATPAATSTLVETPVGGGAQVAFVSERGGAPQIWLVAVDGGDAEQLTDVAQGACQPAWAPDGMRLAYISPCHGRSGTYPEAVIHILDLATGASTRLPTVPGGDFDPAWSPDGTRIAFTSLRIGHVNVYVMNADGSEQTQLSRDTTVLAVDLQPAWSPDGSRLAFVTTRAAAAEIWIMDAADGGSQTRFTRELSISENFSPDWSPDGSLMVYEQHRSGQFPRIVSLVVQEGAINSNALTEPTFPSADPHWSPDGSWLTFEAWPDGSNHDIWIMTSGGDDPQRLTTDPALEYQPAWRPAP